MAVAAASVTGVCSLVIELLRPRGIVTECLWCTTDAAGREHVEQPRGKGRPSLHACDRHRMADDRRLSIRSDAASNEVLLYLFLTRAEADGVCPCACRAEGGCAFDCSPADLAEARCLGTAFSGSGFAADLSPSQCRAEADSVCVHAPAGRRAAAHLTIRALTWRRRAAWCAGGAGT